MLWLRYGGAFGCLVRFALLVFLQSRRRPLDNSIFSKVMLDQAMLRLAMYLPTLLGPKGCTT